MGAASLTHAFMYIILYTYIYIYIHIYTYIYIYIALQRRRATTLIDSPAPLYRCNFRMIKVTSGGYL